MTNPSEKSGSRRGRSTWWQLVLLMWKNLVLRRRHWLLTFFEILLPTALFSIVLFIRLIPGSNFIPEHINATTIFETDSEMRLKEYACSNYGKWINKTNYCFTMPNMRDLQIYYGPYGGFTNSVATHVANELNIPKDALTPVFTNEEMDSLVLQSYYTANITPYYIGLFFNDLDDVDSAPHDLKYDLRLTGTWMTASKYPFLEAAGPANSTFRYLNQGFALIQSLVDRFFISQITGNDTYSDYKVEVQKYPYPSYYNDFGISQLYGSFLPSDVVLSFVLLSPSLIKSIVYEKETGVRELMRLMGMSRWLVWVGWFLHALVVVVVVVTIITIMITVGLHSKGAYIPPILNYSNPFIVWIFLALYGISSITFCLTISTFFSRPTLATTLGVLIWLFSYYIPNSIIYLRYERMSLAPKVLYCLIPNMAMTIGFRVIEMFEGRAVGVQWSNMWETGNPRDQVTPGLLMIMMVVDSVIYCILIWYVDQVSPGTYGVALPWYFPFQKSYWCGSGPAKEAPRAMNDALDPDTRQNFEDEPVGLTPGIIIRNLRKEFKSLGRKVKVAVEDVSMTCYEGQCTVLLGHNGAGKTTTMSILTGVFAPSGGYAEVGGWDIATNLKEAREEVGLCPQHNMLFVDLTVMQHLLFFGRLKGMTVKRAREEAAALMERLELVEKKNMYGNQLSGGMKRKLCLAIALMGDSKVVILDEPSSGLDPESRRWVWDVVQGERGRRTILVTTHHMEEADVLGDRVAIMASGRVVCAGSTLFLKNKFGDGYTLTVMLSEGSKLGEIRREVSQHLPEAALRSAQRGEVTFKLPPTTSLFAPLLDALASRKEDLGVQHLGLTLTSMEQVFLRVGDLMERYEALDGEASYSTNGHLNGNDNIGFNLSAASLLGDPSDLTGGTSRDGGDAYSSQRFLFDSQKNIEALLSGARLQRQRFKAFFAKRAIYSRRKWVLFVTQGLLPVVVTVLCLLVDASFTEDTLREPPLVLSPTMYPYSISYVLASSRHQGLSDAYQSLFHNPYEVYTTDNMTQSLLHEAEENLFRYRENNVCSAEFLDVGTSTALRVLYQSVPYHTPGVSASLVTNALLRFATNSTRHSITTSNRPLPPNRTWKMKSSNAPGSALVYAMVMPLALAFLSASFLVFPLQERETKAKQVQVMTGASVGVLWVTTFLWDYLTYFISAAVVFIVFMTFDTKHYFTTDSAPGALIVMLVMYGWASIPMAYVFSFPFQTAASGFAVLALVNIVAGMIITTAVWALNLSAQPSLLILSDALNWAVSLIPTFPASMGFMHLVNTSAYNSQCDLFNATVKDELCSSLVQYLPTNAFVKCCPHCEEVGYRTCFEKRSYFVLDQHGMAPDLLTLLVNGFIFLVLLVVIEMDSGRMFSWMLKVVPSVSRWVLQDQDSDDQDQDSDVAAEAVLVEAIMKRRKAAADQNLVDNATLLVSGLSKRFLASSRPAVGGITFRVARGECLGLLGVNGAGKTTTFRMLTGDEKPSGGDAMIGNISLQGNTQTFVQQIGYCPQFDAVLGELTGIEMLTLVGRLRGVSEGRMKHTVQSLVSLVGLTECAKRPSSTYSGGNRRKLSTAMALVGSPPLVFLDEPTSGVDPASRRKVWTAVRQAVNNGQSVVLTSHSMEECEALCNRIVIMSRGTLRCVGTSGHLKAKFGQGYSLQVKLRTYSQSELRQVDGEAVYESKVAELKDIIRYHLPGANLTDHHKTMLAFRVPSNISWGQIFKVMEALKTGRDPSVSGSLTPAAAASASTSLVEDYAASDTSLEQVFLSFAREAAQMTPEFKIPTELITRF